MERRLLGGGTRHHNKGPGFAEAGPGAASPLATCHRSKKKEGHEGRQERQPHSPTAGRSLGAPRRSRRTRGGRAASSCCTRGTGPRPRPPPGSPPCTPRAPCRHTQTERCRPCTAAAEGGGSAGQQEYHKKHGRRSCCSAAAFSRALRSRRAGRQGGKQATLSAPKACHRQPAASASMPPSHCHMCGVVCVCVCVWCVWCVWYAWCVLCAHLHVADAGVDDAADAAHLRGRLVGLGARLAGVCVAVCSQLLARCRALLGAQVFFVTKEAVGVLVALRQRQRRQGHALGDDGRGGCAPKQPCTPRWSLRGAPAPCSHACWLRSSKPPRGARPSLCLRLCSCRPAGSSRPRDQTHIEVAGCVVQRAIDAAGRPGRHLEQGAARARVWRRRLGLARLPALLLLQPPIRAGEAQGIRLVGVALRSKEGGTLCEDKRGIADRLSANPSQFLRERLIESPRLRHRPPRDPFTTSGGYCTWRVRQIK